MHTETLSRGLHMHRELHLPRPAVALMVSDHEWVTRGLESILTPNGFAVLHSYTGRAGIERIRSTAPDLVIIDLNLPDTSGVALCRLLRERAALDPRTPVIVITSDPATRQDRLAAFRAGAWDFLGHPLDAEETLLRLTAYARAKLEADRTRDQDLLDGPTGLYNVRGLARRARELGAQAYRQAGPLACVVLRPQVDRDALPSEDEALDAAVVRLADLLRAAGRQSDAIGRVGHAEFAVLAPGTDAAGASSLAFRFADALQHGNGSGNHVRLQVGCYTVGDFRGDHVDPVDLMVRASERLSSVPVPTGRPTS